MISICPHCGSNRWNKSATATHITCPECGHSWPYRRGPLLLLTGCSGVGKTTTGVALSHMQQDFAVLDADMFYIPDDSQIITGMLEPICRFSAALNQQGTAILWTKAGGLDRIKDTYHRQFFSEVKCLALTCEPDELRRRMTDGRGITDEGWLNGSRDYNEYFRTHDLLADVRFDKLDITRLSPDEAAQQVHAWMQDQLHK